MSEVFNDKLVGELQSLGLESMPRFVVTKESPSSSPYLSNSETVFAVRSLDDAVGRMVEAAEENPVHRERMTRSAGSF